MKYLKMLGLAAVAAAALMAFVGVGTASATTQEEDTVLCKVTETPCNANEYPAGTAVTGTSTNATLTAFGGFSQTVCEESNIGGTTDTETTPIGHITEMVFNKCNNPVTVEQTGSTGTTPTYGKMQIHWDAEHNGKITVTEYKVTVHASLTCTFSGEIKTGITAKGGNPATITATAELTKTGGSAFCPSKGIWHADYTVTTPKPLWVSHHTA